MQAFISNNNNQNVENKPLEINIINEQKNNNFIYDYNAPPKAEISNNINEQKNIPDIDDNKDNNIRKSEFVNSINNMNNNNEFQIINNSNNNNNINNN